MINRPLINLLVVKIEGGGLGFVWIWVYEKHMNRNNGLLDVQKTFGQPYIV